MREAVQILVDRTKTHPDEFTRSGRFYWTYEFASSEVHSFCLTPEERRKIREAVEEANYQCFHDNIMKIILGTK